MGVFRLNLSGSSYDQPGSETNPSEPPVPDASRWKILDHRQVGKHLVVKINYPNCTNYEGNKIIVYLDITLEELVKGQILDPHFGVSKKYPTPFARFEPTQKGWESAIIATQILKEN